MNPAATLDTGTPLELIPPMVVGVDWARCRRRHAAAEEYHGHQVNATRRMGSSTDLVLLLCTFIVELVTQPQTGETLKEFPVDRNGRTGNARTKCTKHELYSLLAG